MLSPLLFYAPFVLYPSLLEHAILAQRNGMSGFNWIDFVLIILLLIGMAVGYAQGFVRQVIGIAALYVGLVLATQFFQGASRLIGNIMHAPPNTLTNAFAFFLIFFVAAAAINFLAMDAYKSTHLRIAPIIDHVTGIVLGVGSMWIITTIALNVLLFAVNTQGWGGSAEGFRIILKNGLETSRVAEVTTYTLPMIVSTIRPWLPGGLPALFQL